MFNTLYPNKGHNILAHSSRPVGHMQHYHCSSKLACCKEVVLASMNPTTPDNIDQAYKRILASIVESHFVTLRL